MSETVALIDPATGDVIWDAPRRELVEGIRIQCADAVVGDRIVLTTEEATLLRSELAAYAAVVHEVAVGSPLRALFRAGSDLLEPPYGS